MLNIPLAPIGVIWGIDDGDRHHDAVSTGVRFAGGYRRKRFHFARRIVKHRVEEGCRSTGGGTRASHDRFRAVLLTSLTTIAGMTPSCLKPVFRPRF